MELKEKTFPRNIKGIAKVLEIYGFGIVEYSVRSESRSMIAHRAKACYVTGLPKDLSIISPQVICTSEGYKVTFVAHFHNDHDGYAELNFKEYNPGWQKAEPVERVYGKYDQKKNLPAHKSTLPNQRDK